MNKSEFFKVLNQDLKSAGLSRKQSETNEIASIVFNALADCLTKGHNIDIQNFGSFKLHLRKMRDLSKPHKPEILRWAVSFKSSKNLSKEINVEFQNER